MPPKRKLDSEEEEDVDEELSSDEEGADEDEDMEVSDEEGGEDESEEEVLEPKVLPLRATRGGRMTQLLEDQESGDEEFWSQDFFAEEDRDQEFEASETEEEDVPDTDFSESEEDDDEDDDAVEARTRREERGRKKALKPPGAAGAARRPPPVKTTPLSGDPATAKAPMSPASKAALKAAKQAMAAEFQAPSLRKSTLQKVEEAEKERIENVRPKKKRRTGQQQRLLSQDELLSEAAQTEIENLRSLEALQAAEEEVRKRAAVKRGGYTGPCIRYKTKQINGEGLLTCEVANMLLPANMRHQTAPAPKLTPICVITGRPAKYRDPATGQPYFDVAAFRILQQQRLQGSLYNNHALHLRGVQAPRFQTGYYATY